MAPKVVAVTVKGPVHLSQLVESDCLGVWAVWLLPKQSVVNTPQQHRNDKRGRWRTKCGGCPQIRTKSGSNKG